LFQGGFAGSPKWFRRHVRAFSARLADNAGSTETAAGRMNAPMSSAMHIGKAGIVPMKKIWDNGFRQITSSSSRQLNGVEDLHGFKIRVPVTALLTSLFSGLGALPSSISYSELYSALQTHIVEGQENPLAQVSTG
jgi:hypothetical protein